MMFEFKPKHDDEDGGQADITTLEYRLAVKQTSPLWSTDWQPSIYHHFEVQAGSQANITTSEYTLAVSGSVSVSVLSALGHAFRNHGQSGIIVTMGGRRLK
jgi:hypothetical protein